MKDIKIENNINQQNDINLEIKHIEDNQSIKNEQLEKKFLDNLISNNEQDCTNRNDINKKTKNEEIESEMDEKISIHGIKLENGKLEASNNFLNLNEFNQTKEEKNISDENKDKDKNNIEIIYNNIKEKKLDEINKDSILKTNNQTKNNKEEKNNKNNINIEKENNKNNIKCIDFV